MNRAQKLILEYACQNAHDQKTIDALDTIFARMIAVPIQRAWRIDPQRVVPALKKSWVKPDLSKTWSNYDKVRYWSDSD